MSAEQPEYKVDIEVFEGPLDLLLHLIRRDELDIYDIPIERITSQYLAYLDLMKMLDLSVAGEFVVMAATLMMIKSRMLLPVEERADLEEEEESLDPRLDLIRQLIEYKKFKDAAGRLMAREALLAETFIGGGERELAAAAGEETQLLGDVGLFDLLEAFQQVLERAPAEPFGHLEPIRWSVPDKMAAILALLRRQAVVAFSRLFHERSPRGEIIVTFLSLLELLRLRQVTVRQGRQFAEIEILPVPEASSVTGEDSAAAAASAQEVVHVG